MRQDYAPLGDAVKDTLEMLDNLQQGNVERGVPTGFRDIDDVTQGLQPGQMIVVAGRPAMGKSTLGIDFARAASLHHGLTSIVFSLEMSKTNWRSASSPPKRTSRWSRCAAPTTSRRNGGTR